MELIKNITKDHLKFILLQPVPISDQGFKLL